MPYVGGSVTSLFDKRVREQTRLTMRAMAHQGGDRMVELTVMNTPIKHGNLRSSWYQIPTKRTRYGPWVAYRSGVESKVDYAPHVEFGTGLYGPKGAPYEIRPKRPGGMLRFTDAKTGQEVFASRVMHPGIRGQHMVAIAADVTEMEADSGALFQGLLSEWARKVEALADH